MPLPLKIEARTGVHAPGSVIWNLVSDINGWPAWNPIYPKARGEVQFGAKLELEVVLPGEQPRAIQPTILDWTPGEQIIWTLSLMGGLLRSTRYIEIEVLGETNCIFSNGEIFEGPLMRFMPRKLRRAIKTGFNQFCEVVRERAEAAWQAEGGRATSAG
jgi:hypothetical protein